MHVAPFEIHHRAVVCSGFFTRGKLLYRHTWTRNGHFGHKEVFTVVGFPGAPFSQLCVHANAKSLCSRNGIQSVSARSERHAVEGYVLVDGHFSRFIGTQAPVFAIRLQCAISRVAKYQATLGGRPAVADFYMQVLHIQLYKAGRALCTVAVVHVGQCQCNEKR